MLRVRLYHFVHSFGGVSDYEENAEMCKYSGGNYIGIIFISLCKDRAEGNVYQAK